MTDELERLRTAFAADPAPEPRAAARRAALGAAMAAYEAAEKNPEAGQEGTTERRRRGDRASGPGGTLRRHAMAVRAALSPRGVLIGGTSLATLALAIGVSLHLSAPEADRPLRETDSLAVQARVATGSDDGSEARASRPAEIERNTTVDLRKPRQTADFALREERGTAAAPLAQGLLRAPAPAPAIVHATDLAAPAFREQGRDRFEAVDDNPLRVTAEDPVSTFSIDVDTAAYSVMRRHLMQGVLPPRDAVRVEELVNYFAYDYAPPASAETPFATHVQVFETPWNADTQLLKIGIKGYEIPAEARPPANLVFLLDTSGSMNAPDKLPLLVNAFRLLVERLGTEDRVAIVAYAGTAGTVLAPTPASDRRTILAALERLGAGGATAGGEGLRQAYALAEANLIDDGVNRVILATDGDFNVGIRSTDQLLAFVARKRETGVYLSVLGFGQGNLNDALMQALAQNGNGQAVYIDSLSEAQKVLVDDVAPTLFPIAEDVKIQIEFNPAAVAEHRLIGYETRVLAREDFNNDRVDAGEIGSGHRVTALYEITPVGSPARRVDRLRYAPAETRPAETAARPDEIGFLKIRYKRPGEGESRLIERPITRGDIGAPDTEARFAAAVAGAGQLLRGGAHTGDWGFEEAIALATGARGRDPFGYRAEFVRLLRLAETAGARERQR